MKRGFITGGYWCVDRNMTIPYWPKEDTAVYVLDVKLANGGSAPNFGIDIRKLDSHMPVETIGLIGDDSNGQFLMDIAHEYNIETSQLHVMKGVQTAMTDAYQSLQSGMRTHITHYGSSALLSPDHFNLDITSGKILHLGLPGIQKIMDSPWQGDANGWVSVLKQAKKIGLLTNLELVTVTAQRVRELALPCLPYLDILVVNDFEIGALAEISTSKDNVVDPVACKQAAQIILEKGAMEVVVVHFVSGAQLISRDGQDIFIPSVRVPPSAKLGANGAGDAFAAGFLYGFHEKWSFEQSLRLAHASAAACLRSISTVETVESVEKVMALANDWGWR